jgi:O-antigen ligase
MIKEKPLMGWGVYNFSYELEQRAQLYGYERIDAHNLILYILTATGVLGAIPYFIGIGLCVRSAWKARDGAHGIVPFAMVIALLVSDMSVSGINWKHHWYVLAYALASGSHLLRSRPRPAIIP